MHAGRCSINLDHLAELLHVPAFARSAAYGVPETKIQGLSHVPNSRLSLEKPVLGGNFCD